MANAKSVAVMFSMLTWVWGRKGASVSEIAEKFQLSAKDVRDLINSAGDAHFGDGAPDTLIEFDWNAFYEDDYVHIENIRGLDKYLSLNEDETIAFVLGLYYLSTIIPNELSEDAASAAIKLLSARNIELDLSKFVIVDYEDLAQRRVDIMEAITKHKGLAFGYVNSANKRSHRRVMPLRLFQSGGHWIVEAREAGTGALKSFRLDRMEDLEITEQVQIDNLTEVEPAHGRQVKVKIDPRAEWATEGRAQVSKYRGLRAIYTVYDERWMENNLLLLGDGILECDDPDVLKRASNRAKQAQENRARLRPER